MASGFSETERELLEMAFEDRYGLFEYANSNFPEDAARIPAALIALRGLIQRGWVTLVRFKHIPEAEELIDDGAVDAILADPRAWALPAELSEWTVGFYATPDGIEAMNRIWAEEKQQPLQ